MTCNKLLTPTQGKVATSTHTFFCFFKLQFFINLLAFKLIFFLKYYNGNKVFFCLRHFCQNYNIRKNCIYWECHLLNHKNAWCFSSVVVNIFHWIHIKRCFFGKNEITKFLWNHQKKLFFRFFFFCFIFNQTDHYCMVLCWSNILPDYPKCSDFYSLFSLHFFIRL